MSEPKCRCEEREHLGWTGPCAYCLETSPQPSASAREDCPNCQQMRKERDTEKTERRRLRGLIKEYQEQAGTLIKERDALRAELAEMYTRYRNIELANPELSRNDHVHFGDLINDRVHLLAENQRLRTALETLADENWDGSFADVEDIARQALEKK